MIFVGVDWAEAHHDVCVLDGEGQVLGKRRITEGVTGLADLHALVADHAEDPEEVVVGIETDRGLLVSALIASGFAVYAINPMAASRYRDRHHVSGAKSDPGDAKMLADLVRTDRHNHRRVAGDSDLAEAIKVLARAHQSAIWARQRQSNALRSALREYYPAAIEAFGTDLTSTLSAGSVIDVTGVVNTGGTSTAAFNGTFVVVSVTSTTIVVTQAASGSPGTYASGGTVLAGGGQLVCTIQAVNIGNSQIIYFDSNGVAQWNPAGSAAVIRI